MKTVLAEGNKTLKEGAHFMTGILLEIRWMICHFYPF